MEDDSLATYLDALARDECYRVDRVLKSTACEVTEVVYFVGVNAAELGPFVRKRISGETGLGGAYYHLRDAQRAGRRFRHLPRIYDVHEGDGELVVVMEYVAGRTLRDEVYERDPSLALARQWFPALCEGVRELHELFPAPLIHRDLKPTNVLVGDGALTIIDFGIARAWRPGAESDTAHFGTRSYAPPEQFGYGQTDERTDVYALGMILYYLMAERDPSPALAREGFADPAVPAALRAVLVRACAFDPCARFGSVRELQEAFCAAAGEPAPAAAGEPGPGLAPTPAAAGEPAGEPVAAAERVVPGGAPAPGSVPMPIAVAPEVPAKAGFWGESASGASSPDAPVLTGRVVAVLVIWAFFFLVLLTMPFDPSEEYAGWPLPLLMVHYYTFGVPFCTGVAILCVGDRFVSRVLRCDLTAARKRRRVIGWALVAAGVVAVWVTSAIARMLGYPI